MEEPIVDEIRKISVGHNRMDVELSTRSRRGWDVASGNMDRPKQRKDVCRKRVSVDSIGRGACRF